MRPCPVSVSSPPNDSRAAHAGPAYTNHVYSSIVAPPLYGELETGPKIGWAGSPSRPPRVLLFTPSGFALRPLKIYTRSACAPSGCCYFRGMLNRLHPGGKKRSNCPFPSPSPKSPPPSFPSARPPPDNGDQINDHVFPQQRGRRTIWPTA